MTALELWRRGEEYLQPHPDARWDARELLMSLFPEDRNRLASVMGKEVTAEQEKRYQLYLEQRKAGMPLQYILREAWFMGLPFYVDERVLIPRQDTELLCEEALLLAKKHGLQTAFDLCTGSGALAVSLGRLSPLRVSACDISPAALSVARRNAEKNGVSVAFYEGDFLTPVKGTTFDLIVCNPPYLTQDDMENLQWEVKKEPSLALFGGADGLDFYRRLQAEAGAFLSDGGYLLMEIGCTQGESVLSLFSRWNAALKKDINGLDRVIIARKPTI